MQPREKLLHYIYTGYCHKKNRRLSKALSWADKITIDL